MHAKHLFRSNIFNTVHFKAHCNKRKLNNLHFKNDTRYQGFEFKGVLAMYCKKRQRLLINYRTLLKKWKSTKCKHSSGLDEQFLVNFSRQSERKNSFRLWWVKVKITRSHETVSLLMTQLISLFSPSSSAWSVRPEPSTSAYSLYSSSKSCAQKQSPFKKKIWGGGGVLCLF